MNSPISKEEILHLVLRGLVQFPKISSKLPSHPSHARKSDSHYKQRQLKPNPSRRLLRSRQRELEKSGHTA